MVKVQDADSYGLKRLESKNATPQAEAQGSEEVRGSPFSLYSIFSEDKGVFISD